MSYIVNQIEKHKRDRWDLVQAQRSVLERAEKEDRSMTPEERAEIDNMGQAIQGHESRIADLEKINGQEGDEPAAVTDEASARSRRFSKPMELETRGEGERFNSTKEYRRDFAKFMQNGEKRDVSLGTQAAGGYLVTPTEISNEIVKQIYNLFFIEQKARKQRVQNVQAYGVRQMTARMSNPALMTETASNTADTTMTFARRDLTPHIATKLVLVSQLILDQAPASDVVALLEEEYAYKFGELRENKFLNGSGSGEPLGVFTASASGVPTTQDVTSGATADFIADDLIKMRYALKQPYLQGDKCMWTMGRSIVQEVRTFKDSYGQYLWRPGLAGNAPDTILDIPLGISEYCPTTKTSGSYIAVLGNFDYYQIVEVADLQVQRLNELYQANNQVGFLGRWYFDGSPVLGEAFCRLKTA